MKKYLPELDTVSDILASIPHPQIQLNRTGFVGDFFI